MMMMMFPVMNGYQVSREVDFADKLPRRVDRDPATVQNVPNEVARNHNSRPTLQTNIECLTVALPTTVNHWTGARMF